MEDCIYTAVYASEVEVESELGCGVVDHDPACLCDVVIGADGPAPIRFGLHEIDHVVLAARFLGLGRPWRGRDLADVMTPVLQVYDQTHTYTWDVPPPEPLRPNRTIRTDLMEHHRSGGTMAAAMQHWGLSFEEWRVTVLNGDHSRAALLRQEDWEEIERLYLEGTVASTTTLAETYGLCVPGFIKIVRDLGWKSKANDRNGKRFPPEFIKAMRELIAQDLGCTMVTKGLHDQFGYTCDRRLVSYHRNQMTKAGEL